jgi:hypothetical protein
MKKYLGISILLLLICGTSVFAQQTNFITPEQAIEDIKNFYRKRQNLIHVSIYLLEIIKSQDDSDIMLVYFLKDIDPDTVKNIDGIIDNRNIDIPIKVAVYNYSHLKNTWRLFEIKSADSGLVLEVD